MFKSDISIKLEFGKTIRNIDAAIAWIRKIQAKVKGHMTQINATVIHDLFVKGVTANLRANHVKTDTPRMRELLEGFKVKTIASSRDAKRFEMEHSFFINKTDTFSVKLTGRSKTFKIRKHIIFSALENGRKDYTIPKPSNSKAKILVWKMHGKKFVWDWKERGPIHVFSKNSHIYRNGIHFTRWGQQEVAAYIEMKRQKIAEAMKGI